MDERLPWALESIQGNILCGRLIRVIQQHVRSLEMSQSSVIMKVWNVCLNLHGSEQKCIQPVCRSLIEESVWMVAVTHAWLFAQISLRILIWNVCVCVCGASVCLLPSDIIAVQRKTENFACTLWMNYAQIFTKGKEICRIWCKKFRKKSCVFFFFPLKVSKTNCIRLLEWLLEYSVKGNSRFSLTLSPFYRRDYSLIRVTQRPNRELFL